MKKGILAALLGAGMVFLASGELPAAGSMRVFPAKVLRVLDGDTMSLDIDMGFETHRFETVRVDGVDAPELKTIEGRKVKETVRALLEGKDVTFEDHGKEKYGRRLGSLIFEGQDFGQHLIKNGMAKEYHGGKREP